MRAARITWTLAAVYSPATRFSCIASDAAVEAMNARTGTPLRRGAAATLERREGKIRHKIKTRRAPSSEVVGGEGRTLAQTGTEGRRRRSSARGACGRGGGRRRWRGGGGGARGCGEGEGATGGGAPYAATLGWGLRLPAACLWLGGKREEEGLEVRVVDEEQRRGEAKLAGQRPRV